MAAGLGEAVLEDQLLGCSGAADQPLLADRATIDREPHQHIAERHVSEAGHRDADPHRPALRNQAAIEADALDLAQRIVSGPTFAHGITKTQLNQEWSMGLDQAIEAEAQAQAICMQTMDFERAYRAFVAKDKPVFEGN